LRPATASLSLTGNIPRRSIGTTLTVPAGSLALSAVAPVVVKTTDGYVLPITICHLNATMTEGGLNTALSTNELNTLITAGELNTILAADALNVEIDSAMLDAEMGCH
jgi:hypothetical protein